VPGVKDVLAAGKKQVEIVPLADLLEPVSVLDVIGRERPAQADRLGKIFSGETAAAELVSALYADGVL
jgi:electron transfer flavoprotein beta subunit